MSATEIHPLPSPDDVAWIDELIAVGALKLTEIVETLEAAVEHVKVGENEYRTRLEFEPMSLEQLARLLLLAELVSTFARELEDDAKRLKFVAHTLYRGQEDTGGVVASCAGLEPYAKHRRNNAAASTRPPTASACAGTTRQEPAAVRRASPRVRKHAAGSMM